MAEVYIFSEDDKLLTTLAESNVLISAPIRDELNQVADTPFSFIVEAENIDGKVVPASHIKEENRAVFRDREGKLREYVIKEIEDISNYQGPKVEVTCIPSFLDELSNNVIEDRRINDRTAKFAMDVALEGTRFEAVAGELGINSISFYYKTSVDAIWEIRNKWGGDIEAVVHLSEDGTHIERREIHLVPRLGEDRGLRLDAEHNADEIVRTVLSYPVTAMYGRGASLEMFDEEGEATGGFTRYIDFADVEWKKSDGYPVDKPLGQKWIGDPDALAKYGIKTKQGPIHKTAIFSNQDYETPEELIWATWYHLQENKDPKVNYKVIASILDKPAHLGDTAVALDRKFARPIEIQTRIIAVEYDLVDIEGTLKVEMGDFLNLDDGIQDELENIKKTINKPKPERPIDKDRFPDIKPPVPTGFKAVGAYSKVLLTWDYISNVSTSHYEIYASEVKSFIPQPQHLIWRGKSGSYIHESATNKKWYYRLREVNYHGTASDFTSEVGAETLQINADTDISEYTITKHLLAQEAIIESIHIGEATISDLHLTGKISASRLVITKDSEFEDGYDPSEKEGKKVRAKTPPSDKSVIWIDTTDPNNIIWKVWDPDKSAWVAGPGGPKGDKGAKGDPGNDGRGVLKSEVVYRYHTSGEEVPPGPWLANVPAPQKGMYLWTRMTTTYTDNSEVRTYSVAYQATDGQKGENGKGITSTEIRYQLSTSGTTVPTGTWLSSIPSPVKGQYLWTRTVISYSEGPNSTAYSTSYYATDGQKGEKGDPGPQGIPGPKGADGQSLYTWIKYADTPTTGMSDSPTGKKYIGIAYNKPGSAKSLIYSDYSWSLIEGPQGVQGPKGSDGQSLYTWIKYADTKTGGGMSDNPDGKLFIGIAYNKTSSVKSDNANDYAWSEMPQSIEVGGRNLALMDNWITWGGGEVERDSYLLTLNSSTTSGAGVSQDAEALGLLPNKQYILSFKVRKTAGTLNTIGGHTDASFSTKKFYKIDGVEYSNGFSSPPTIASLNDGKWHTVEYSFMTPSTITDSHKIYIQPNRDQYLAGTIVDVEDLQVEQATNTGSWNPAPEDIQDQLNDKAGLGDIDNLAEIISDISAEVNLKAGMGEMQAMEEAFNARIAQDIEDKAAVEQALSDIEGRTTLVEILAENSKLVTQFIDTVITESEEGIFIGNQANNTGVLIATDRISFLDNGTEVAYISNKTMEITHGIFVETATIADFKFERIPGTEILTITWVGD